MTEESNREAGDDKKEVATAFDRSIDPLAAHASTFDQLTVDPFELFCTEVLAKQDRADGTWNEYDRTFRQWQSYMDSEDRHPACPNGTHVEGFVQYLQTKRDNQPDTARKKLRLLNKTYRYWQQDPAFPHSSEYNPFELMLSRLDLERPPVKDPPRLSITELADVLTPVTDIRDRAIIVMQLKLGLRASELCNLRLEEIHVDCSELERAYPSLGNRDVLTDRPNAVYIPSRYDRDKNKSRRPRVLPIDEELQSILRHYLFTRPDTGADEVFLTTLTHDPLNHEYVNRTWHDVFRPAYDETEQHRAISSHYGRHRFTTYWQVDVPIDRELVKYMRGDIVEGDYATREAIDNYVHTYYEDIESVYRGKIFELFR